MNVPRGGSSPYGAYGSQATDYARASAGPARSSAEKIRALLARYISPENLQTEVEGLYAPTLSRAEGFGERVGAAGTALAGGLTNLASGFQNINPDEISLALTEAARSGASGSMLGESLVSDVLRSRASSLGSARRRREEEMRGLELGAIEKEEEAGRIEADILTPAAQMGDLEGRMLDRRMLREQLRDLPVQRRAQRIANMAAQGELTTQALQQAGMVKELQSMGFKVVKRGGRTQIRDNNGSLIATVGGPPQALKI